MCDLYLTTVCGYFAIKGGVCDSLLLPLYAHADATHPQSCTVLAIHHHMSPLTPPPLLHVGSRTLHPLCSTHKR